MKNKSEDSSTAETKADHPYRDKLKRVVFEVLKFMVIVFIASSVISYWRAPVLEESVLPALCVNTISGEMVDLGSQGKKPVLIHFWATWCPTCKAEADNIEWISQYYDVVTIAVASGDDVDIRAYLKEHDLGFKTVNDRGSLKETFRVSVFPTTFIYDAAGTLAFTEVGYTTRLGLWLRMWWSE